MSHDSTYEFLKWIPTPGEKYLGVAVIRFERRFIFRFKIIPRENGEGLWAATASIKSGVQNGKDKYEPSFSLDSDYEKQMLQEFVVEHVTQAIKKNHSQQSPSVFGPTQSTSNAGIAYPQGASPTTPNQQTDFFNDSDVPF